MTTIGSSANERRARAPMTVARIAHLAGVSAPTVSKVINGHAGVAPETRRRIEELIREHQYRRAEHKPTAGNLEIVFQALDSLWTMDSLWALEIIRGVQKVARERELAVAITDMQASATPGRSWSEQVASRHPAGVITVSGQLTRRQQTHLTAAAIPVVALDPSGEPDHAVPSVGATNWNGGLVATRHLLELGHRRIAMISGPRAYLCCRARLDGFRTAMDAAGISVGADLLREGPLHVEGGRDAAGELLGLADPPTAIFTANDLQAVGVYEAARHRGLHIPRDLSVVGFDDLAFVQWSAPPLTTVRQPLAEMGAAAATMLLELAAGKRPAYGRLELPTTLVVRESTAAPRKR